jgi:hypothetical protein
MLFSTSVALYFLVLFMATQLRIVALVLLNIGPFSRALVST